MLCLIPETNRNGFLIQNISNYNLRYFTLTKANLNTELERRTSTVFNKSGEKNINYKEPLFKNSKFNITTKIFVWELCCSEPKEITDVLKLNEHDTSVIIVYERNSNKLLFRKYFNWNQKLITFRKISLKKNEHFITFIVDKNGFMNLYFDCNYKLYLNKINAHRFKLRIELKNFSDPKLFEYDQNIRIYDDLDEVSKAYKCPMSTKSVLDGSILYFHENFNLNSTSNNLISFKHDSEFYSICYKNKQIEISSHSSTSSIKIELNPSHNFTFGLYLYFKCPGVEIYDSCPSTTNSLANTYVGVWYTNIFTQSLFIRTYRKYISSNAVSSSTLEMFCNNADSFRDDELKTCSSINRNSFKFDETNKIMNKYIPPMFKKYLTLNLHEGYIHLKNSPVLLVASRQNSKMGFFNRSMSEYKEGFTDGQFNFWIGLDILHKLTSANKFRFRIVALTQTRVKFMEEYSFVNVTDSRDKYRLILGKIRSGKGFFAVFNNTEFSTYDSGDLNLAKTCWSDFWQNENEKFCFNCQNMANLSFRVLYIRFYLVVRI